ncbi:MAG: hypothetical protein K0Q79_1683 [Flavipsychrobacter sp.]|jgi:hypothetical protein|nr:hypothetical protein [Flavipsychrobacter sp.]
MIVLGCPAVLFNEQLYQTIVLKFDAKAQRARKAHDIF